MISTAKPCTYEWGVPGETCIAWPFSKTWNCINKQTKTPGSFGYLFTIFSKAVIALAEYLASLTQSTTNLFNTETLALSISKITSAASKKVFVSITSFISLTFDFS